MTERVWSVELLSTTTTSQASVVRVLATVSSVSPRRPPRLYVQINTVASRVLAREASANTKAADQQIAHRAFTVRSQTEHRSRERRVILREVEWTESALYRYVRTWDGSSVRRAFRTLAECYGGAFRFKEWLIQTSVAPMWCPFRGVSHVRAHGPVGP